MTTKTDESILEEDYINGDLDDEDYPDTDDDLFINSLKDDTTDN